MLNFTKTRGGGGESKESRSQNYPEKVKSQKSCDPMSRATFLIQLMRFKEKVGTALQR